MKQTVLLAAIAIGLGVFTYHFQEKGDIKKAQEEKKQYELLPHDKLGELKSFEIKRSKITKIGSSFYVGEKKEPVDNVKLDVFFQSISNMALLRKFEDKEAKELETKVFSKKDPWIKFVFDKGYLRVQIGQKQPHAHGFYVKIQSSDRNEIALAHDGSPQTEAVEPEEYRLQNRRYYRLTGLLNLGEGYFLDKHMFRGEMAKFIRAEWRNAKVENIRNRDFSISIAQKTTTPAAFGKALYNKNAFSEFEKKLKSILASEIYPLKESNLKQKISSLTIGSSQGEFSLKLYRKYGSLTGYFIRPSFEEKVYEVSSEVIPLFFSNAQDFWDKRVFSSNAPRLKVDGEGRENFSFQVKSSSEVGLFIPPGEDFKVELIGLQNNIEPNNLAFSKLFTFLFTQGEYLSEVTNKKPCEKSVFIIKFEGNRICGNLIENTLEMINVAGSFKVHYNIGEELPFGSTFNDYFIKR